MRFQAQCYVSTLQKGLMTGLVVFAMSGCGPQAPAPTNGREASPVISKPVPIGRATAAMVQEGSLSGGAVLESITTEIGTLRPTWAVCTLPTKGSTISLALRPIKSATSAYLLEIEEVHNRRNQSFGCQVLVNGQPVYFRSYEEMAAGPNRYYVQVPRALAPDGRLNVTFRNDGYAPLSLSRVWAYSDFFELATEEQTYQPMPIFGEALVFLSSLTPAGKDIDWQALGKAIDTPQDVQAWKDLQTRLAGTGYGCGPFINLQYALQPFAGNKAAIDQGLERASKLGVDFQLAFNSGEWGSHPNGPDGLGGYFSDIVYSNISYDGNTKTYRPCWPGTPGNTTWPAWNDPQLQRFLRHRLKQIVRYYLDRRDLMAARGVHLPYPAIDQDWGLASAVDCSDSSRAAAKRDGVDFRPEDGLDEREKQWLYRTYSEVPKRFGAWFNEAARRDAVVVDRGEIRLPKQQTVDDYHFQTFADAQNSPFKDHRWAAWQYAVGDQTNVTGEFLPHLPAAYFDYIAAQGKLLCPNMERMALPTLEYLQTCYERGFRSIWICNARNGDIELFAPQSKGQDDRPCSPVPAVGAKLLDGPDAPGLVIATSNLRTVKKGEELQLQDGGKPGSITYRLANDGRPFDGALDLDLTARFADGEGNAIEVAISNADGVFVPVARLTAKDMPASNHYPWKRHTKVKLGETLRGRTSGQLRLTLIGVGGPSGVGVEDLRVSLPWATPSGHPGREPFTVKQARILHLWNQDRAILERTQAKYRRLAGDDETLRQAAALALDGRIASAYRLLSGALSQLLPARFSIRGHGVLGSYPISLKLADDDQTLLVDLTKAGPDGCVLAVTTEKVQRFQLALGGLRDGISYAVAATGSNTWSIAPSTASDALRATGGKLTVTLDASPIDYRIHPLPAKLSGTFAGEVPGGILIDTQAPELWLDNPIFVPVSATTAWTRVAAGNTKGKSEHAQGRDRVDLTIINGIAQSVQATYGTAAGRIRSFQPPICQGKTSNGIIELEDGGRYEFANMWGFTQLEVPKLKWMIRFHTPDQLQKVLKPGLQVSLDFSPSTVDGCLPRIIRLAAPRPPRDPNLAAYPVYSEGMAAGWFQNGWSSIIDPANTVQAHTGTTAMAITITAAGGAGGAFHLNGTFDPTPYRSISFWINGGTTGGQKLKLALAESGQSWQLPGPLAPKTWVKHTIKLEDIGAQDVDDLSALRFIDQEGSSMGKTFFVDDISFDP